MIALSLLWWILEPLKKLIFYECIKATSSSSQVKSLSLFSFFPLALFASCDTFRWVLCGHGALSSSVANFFQDEGPEQRQFFQEFVRTKHYSAKEIVQVQPHLVHNMALQEVRDKSYSQDKMDSTNISQLNPASSVSEDIARTFAAVVENLDVEDKIEVRMS